VFAISLAILFSIISSSEITAANTKASKSRHPLTRKIHVAANASMKN
jgi:hypothetical protein